MQLDREQFERAITQAISGTSKSRLMRQCALSAKDAQWLQDRVGMSSLEFQAQVLSELELVRSRLIEILYEKADKLNPNYLGATISALTDKILKLNPYTGQDQPQAVRNQVNIQINGTPVNKRQILEELYGNVVEVDAESVKESDTTGLGKHACGTKSKVEIDRESGDLERGATDSDPDTEDEGESDSTENKSLGSDD